MTPPVDTPWIPLSEDEHAAIEREGWETTRDYSPPIWGPMPSEHYQAMKRRLRGEEGAQEVVDQYASKVRLLRSYLADLEALIAVEAPWLVLSPAVHLGRCMALGVMPLYNDVAQARKAA